MSAESSSPESGQSAMAGCRRKTSPWGCFALTRQNLPQAGQSIARGEPYFSDIQVSASDAQVERRYDPKRAGAWLAKVCESRVRKRAKARGEFSPLKLRKLRKWPPSGRSKAAKVTDLPRRP
eukprot:2639753-Prymnesium_polylepis.1